MGKSTAIATVASKPLVIDLDGRFPGALIDKADVLNVKGDYQSILTTLHGVLAESKLEHDWLQIDTATKVMSAVEEWTVQKDCAGSKDKYNAYGHGLKFSPMYFKEILDLVDEIQAKHKIDVAFICHSRVKNFQNPMTEAYTKNVLDLPEAVADKLKQWADYVGYAYFEVEVDKEKRKASGDPKRYISFTESPLYEAKNSSSFKIPKRLRFDKDGEWAEVVFGKTQDLLIELDVLLSKFKDDQTALIRNYADELDVWSFGVKRLKEFIVAGNQKLNKKGA